jgi:hypothetical protein
MLTADVDEVKKMAKDGRVDELTSKQFAILVDINMDFLGAKTGAYDAQAVLNNYTREELTLMLKRKRRVK